MEAKARTTSSEFQPVTSADEPTSRIRADFEGLLGFAEELQRSWEEQAANYQKLYIWLQSSAFLLLVELLAGLFVFLNLLLSSSNLQDHRILHFTVVNVLSVAALVFGGLITFSYSLSLQKQFRMLKHRMRINERDIAEVVELLREIEPVFAKQEKLSALERVQIRIRLSRFGIGSSSRSESENAAKDMKSEFQSRKSRVDQELMKPF